MFRLQLLFIYRRLLVKRTRTEKNILIRWKQPIQFLVVYSGRIAKIASKIRDKNETVCVPPHRDGLPDPISWVWNERYKKVRYNT
jgi:hypothetical protein